MLQERRLQQQRKILDEKNIAPASVTGTGKGGRVTKTTL
jgi:pyruvate/2-oxoglutarate dehydrogenase complex dihydrolipoamide acyltransferase (E2) component